MVARVRACCCVSVARGAPALPPSRCAFLFMTSDAEPSTVSCPSGPARQMSNAINLAVMLQELTVSDGNPDSPRRSPSAPASPGRVEHRNTEDFRVRHAELGHVASATLTRRRKKVNKRYHLVHGGLQLFGALLMLAGFILEIVSLFSGIIFGGTRQIGMTLALSGWISILLSLCQHFTGGFDRRSILFRLLRKCSAGIGLCTLCSIVSMVSNGVNPMCILDLTDIDNSTAAGGGGSDGGGGESMACASERNLEGAGIVLQAIACSMSMVVLVGLQIFHMRHTMLPSRVLANVVQSTRLQIMGAWFGCAFNLAARGQLSGDVALIVILLLAYTAALPFARHRILQLIWGLSLTSESNEAAEIALRMAGRVAGGGTEENDDEIVEVRVASLKTLLEDAKKSFRVLPFLKMSLDSFTGGHKGLDAETFECNLGCCDAFISHSWRDSGEARWTVLRDWAAAFQRMNRRAPLLWIDMGTLLPIEPQTVSSLPLSLSLPAFSASCLLCLVPVPLSWSSIRSRVSQRA